MGSFGFYFSFRVLDVRAGNSCNLRHLLGHWSWCMWSSSEWWSLSCQGMNVDVEHFLFQWSNLTLKVSSIPHYFVFAGKKGSLSRRSQRQRSKKLEKRISHNGFSLTNNVRLQMLDQIFVSVCVVYLKFWVNLLAKHFYDVVLCKDYFSVLHAVFRAD